MQPQNSSSNARFNCTLCGSKNMTESSFGRHLTKMHGKRLTKTCAIVDIEDNVCSEPQGSKALVKANPIIVTLPGQTKRGSHSKAVGKLGQSRRTALRRSSTLHAAAHPVSTNAENLLNESRARSGVPSTARADTPAAIVAAVRSPCSALSALVSGPNADSVFADHVTGCQRCMADISVSDVSQYWLDLFLLVAVQQGRINATRALLKRGASPSFVGDGRQGVKSSTLHAAITAGPHRSEILQALCVASRYVDQLDGNGNTPLDLCFLPDVALHLPARYNAIKHLLGAGANANRPDAKGDLPIHKFLNIMEKFSKDSIAADCLRSLANATRDINSKSASGLRPLHLASMKSDVAVGILLRREADTSLLDDSGYTALNCASTADIVKVLVSQSRDQLRCRTNGLIALHVAVSDGRGPALILELLRSSSIENVAVTDDGRSCLHLLLKSKPTNETDSQGNRIARAIWLNRRILSVAPLLISYGCDVNFKDVSGLNILQAYLRQRFSWGPGSKFRSEGTDRERMELVNSNFKVVKMLLERGADPNIMDDHGRMVLGYLLSDFEVCCCPFRPGYCSSVMAKSITFGDMSWAMQMLAEISINIELIQGLGAKLSKKDHQMLSAELRAAPISSGDMFAECIKKVLNSAPIV